MSRANVQIIGMVLMGLLTACATDRTQLTSKDGAEYFDAAYNDRNRAPASMTPPVHAADSSRTLDPVNIRAQADFHFAAGEAYSLEGLHSKAIESFKTVLIYDADSVPVRLRLAAEYVKMGSMSEALRLAEEAVEREPTRKEARLLLGGLYSSLKNYKKALQQYEAILKVEPTHSDALTYLGAVHSENKDYDKAIRAFETLANASDYQYPETAYYYIGRIREEQGTKPALKGSEVAFKKALELRPNYAEAAVALSGLYMKQQKSPLALEVLKKFQRDHGPDMKVADLLTSLYLQDEKYDEAIEQMQVLESDPDESLNIKVKMALIYIDQKQYPRAAAKLSEVLRIAPDSDKIRFYLAAVYEEMGQGVKAAEHFQKVPSSSSYYQDSVVHAAYLLKESKKKSDAIKLVRAALKERQDIPQFYAVYASLMDDPKDIDGAMTVLKEGIQKFPDYVQLRFFMGTLLDKQGKKPEVIVEMKKVIEMDPNHVQGLNYLAFTYADTGENLDEAEAYVKRALELEPKDGYILDTYGWIQFRKGNYAESIKALESAHHYQPAESVIAEHLGDAYFKMHLLEKARVMYQKAAEVISDEGKLNEIRSKITTIDKQEVFGLSQRKPASVVPQVKSPDKK